MEKKNLVILLSAVLALLLVAAILISVNWDKDEPDNGETTETTGETVPSTNEGFIIDVEETEPQFTGGNTEIDFDDLINAGNNNFGNGNTGNNNTGNNNNSNNNNSNNNNSNNSNNNNSNNNNSNNNNNNNNNSDTTESTENTENTEAPKNDNVIDFDDLIGLG